MYNILIVDDEQIIRRGIKAFVNFKKLNIGEVYEASNGKEGLELFRDRHIDIVLADINMPIMNGLEMATQMKKIKPQTMIGLITGYDYFDYAVTALKAGVDDYVLKPVSRKDIEALLIKLVQKLQKELKESMALKVAVDLEAENSGDSKKVMNNIIEANLSNSQLSLQFLANEMGFSSGYLSGLFKKTFGVPFSEYILSKRLENAKLLLLSTELKVYEIGEKVGILDPNYFSAIFKKKIGLSPKQYKDSVIK